MTQFIRIKFDGWTDYLIDEIPTGQGLISRGSAVYLQTPIQCVSSTMYVRHVMRVCDPVETCFSVTSYLDRGRSSRKFNFCIERAGACAAAQLLCYSHRIIYGTWAPRDRTRLWGPTPALRMNQRVGGRGYARIARGVSHSSRVLRQTSSSPSAKMCVFTRMRA